MPAKKAIKKTSRRQRSRPVVTPPAASTANAAGAVELSATPKMPRPITQREQFRRLAEQSNRIYNDLRQTQRERDGLLALIAIAEGQGAIRRENDKERD